MSHDPVSRFFSSMVMDYEKWHDGIGYAVDLINGMSDEQKRRVEAKIREKGISDWRDLEALDRLGTQSAIEAILEVRRSESEELALRAQEYGPPVESNEREAAILRGLSSPGSQLDAIDDAAEHPTPRIIAKLFECARGCTGTEAYQAALALYFIHGKVDSMDSWDHRKFLLRFVDRGPDKDAAVEELRAQFRLGD